MSAPGGSQAQLTAAAAARGGRAYRVGSCIACNGTCRHIAISRSRLHLGYFLPPGSRLRMRLRRPGFLVSTSPIGAVTFDFGAVSVPATIVAAASFGLGVAAGLGIAATIGFAASTS